MIAPQLSRDGVSLAAFSTMVGKSEQQLRRLAKAGRIVGARKHAHSNKWWVYPPAQLVGGRHW